MRSRPLILLHVALNSPRRTASNRGASDKRTATTATVHRSSISSGSLLLASLIIIGCCLIVQPAYFLACNLRRRMVQKSIHCSETKQHIVHPIVDSVLRPLCQRHTSSSLAAVDIGAKSLSNLPNSPPIIRECGWQIQPSILCSSGCQESHPILP